MVIELRARFDEEANINCAAQLEAAGVQVVYGVVGYKTPREDDADRAARVEAQDAAQALRAPRHRQLPPGTARLYTDFGLMTADPEIGEDVHQVFQQLSGLGARSSCMQCCIRRSRCTRRLLDDDSSAKPRTRGPASPARIVAKMNALNEPKVIAALYAASQAGVQIDLIVRGACSLRPGVPGSVGEHPRALDRRALSRAQPHLLFHATAARERLLSSADWMERNFFRRVEVAFPIRDRRLKRRVIAEGLSVFLGDNQSAWLMQSDGHYRRRRPGKSMRNAQLGLLAKFCS